MFLEKSIDKLMVSLYGVTVQNKLTVFRNLIKIKGINKTRVQLICKFFGFHIALKSKFLNDFDWWQIQVFIKQKEWIVGTDVDQKMLYCIQDLVLLKLYRGLRHKAGLSVRGQQTRSNSKTQKKIGSKRVLMR